MLSPPLLDTALEAACLGGSVIRIHYAFPPGEEMAGTGTPGYASVCTRDSNQDNVFPYLLYLLNSSQFLYQAHFYHVVTSAGREGREELSPAGVATCAAPPRPSPTSFS